MKTSSIVLACLMLAASCSKVKELDKRTESLETKTTEMSETTTEIKADQEKELSLARANSRLELLKHIMSEETDLQNKIFDVSSYFKAFDYQHLTPKEAKENRALKEKLYEEAVNEFAARIGGVHKQIRVEKFKAGKEKLSNAEQVFYAFALTLHMNHHFQDIMIPSESNLQKNSLNDMIMKGLSRNSKQENLDPHETILVHGLNEEVMIDLLKARVDILSAEALKNLTDKEKMSIPEQGKEFLFRITGGRLGSIDLPEKYDILNNETKEVTEDYLEAALKTKKFLLDIGVNKKLEKSLLSAFKNLDFNDKKAKDESNIVSDKRKETLKGMISQLVE